MRKKIIVRGPALSRSGYGEQTRFALRSLKAHEERFDIYLLATPWGKTGWMYKDNEERRWIDSLLAKTIEHTGKGCTFDISLQITIPNEWEPLAPYNVGYTAGIETTKIAPVWVEKSNIMDKIIVVSEHAKYGFDNTSYEATNEQTGEVIPEFKCQTPIEVVNYPIRNFEPADLDIKFDYDFNYLVVAQWSPRKNVENTIRWFVEEFKDDEVGLILKMNTANNCTMDREATQIQVRNLLAPYSDRKCKVYVLHGAMSDEEMTALYKHKQVKAFVTLAHGEGFGLPIFEAAYNGVPVVSPNWSGQCDFLYAPIRNKKTKKIKKKPLFAKVDYTLQPIQPEAHWDGVLQPDSMWCFADEKSYKLRLREVFKAYPRFASMARNLQAHVLENFTAEQKYKQFADVIHKEEIFNVDEWMDSLNAQVHD